MTVEIFSCQIKQTELHTAFLHQQWICQWSML